MATKPNFKAIAQTPILDVCAALGIVLSKQGRGRCPICDHDSIRSFTTNAKLGRFWCFGHCRAGGDCIELVAQVKKVSHYQAACWIRDNLNSS